MAEITDPNLLAQLEGGGGAGAPAPVTDPNLLRQLDAPPGGAAADVLPDVAKSAAIAVPEAAIGIAGLPGWAKGKVAEASDWIAGKLGATPEQIAKVQAYRAGMPLDISKAAQPPEAIQSAVENVTGPFYQPQTTPGQYANTATQFAVSGLAGGARAVPSFLTGLASEAAGQATAGTAAEPYARLGAAVAAPIALSREAPAVLGPNAAKLKERAQAGYEHPLVKEVVIKPAPLDNLASAAAADVSSRFGRVDLIAPKTANMIEELRPASGTRTIADVDSVRKGLGTIAKERDSLGQPTAEAAAATQARAAIDNFLPNLTQADLARGNAGAAVPILQTARANYQAYKRVSEMEQLLKQGVARAETSGSGGNIGNAIRQEFRPLYVKDYKSRGLSPETMGAIGNLVKPGVGAQALRAASAFDPVHSKLALMLHGLPALATGGTSLVAQAPAMAAGYAARKAYDAMMKSRAGAVAQTIAAQSPLGKAMGATVPQFGTLTPAVRQGMLAGGLGAAVSGQYPFLPFAETSRR